MGDSLDRGGGALHRPRNCEAPYRVEEGGGPSVRSALGPKWNGPQMGHSTTVSADASYAAERFIEHPHRGHFRGIDSVVRLVPRRGHRARYTARPTKNPHPGGTAMATGESMASIIPDMPPWILDHVAAMRNDQATAPVRRATMIPDTMDATRRPMSFLSAGPWAALHRTLNSLNPLNSSDGPRRLSPERRQFKRSAEVVESAPFTHSAHYPLNSHPLSA
jgi:hypothetical protein